MRKWTVLLGLLGWFLLGDILGGMAANRFGLGNMGELAVEFVLFGVVAGVAFWRWLR